MFVYEEEGYDDGDEGEYGRDDQSNVVELYLGE